MSASVSEQQSPVRPLPRRSILVKAVSRCFRRLVMDVNDDSLDRLCPPLQRRRSKNSEARGGLRAEAS